MEKAEIRPSTKSKPLNDMK